MDVTLQQSCQGLRFILKLEQIGGAGLRAGHGGAQCEPYTAQARRLCHQHYRTFRNSSSRAFGSLVKHKKFMSALALNLEL
jgi:hypothetical protein